MCCFVRVLGILLFVFFAINVFAVVSVLLSVVYICGCVLDSGSFVVCCLVSLSRWMGFFFLFFVSFCSLGPCSILVLVSLPVTTEDVVCRRGVGVVFNV